MEVALLLVSPLVVGCGGIATENGPGGSPNQPDASVDEAHSTHDATDDGRDSSLDDGAPDAGPDTFTADAEAGDDAIVSDATDPCSVDPGGYFSCCNGVPCRGSCASYGCHCNDILGGCEAPSICCTGGCTGVEGCGI
jgi:hypothetical protein